MTMRGVTTAVVCALVLVIGRWLPAYAQSPAYEVWVTDQSGTDATNLDGDPDGNKKDGGFIYVFQGKTKGGINQKPAQLNLVQLFRGGVKPTWTGGVKTGEAPFAYPVGQRPHIVGFNVEGTYAAINFMGQNKPLKVNGPACLAPAAPCVNNPDFDAGVAFMRVADKKIVGFVNNLNGLHMPSPSPDSSLLAGVSINQKRLHVFTTDYANERFEMVTGSADPTAPHGIDLATLRQDSNFVTPGNDDEDAITAGLQLSGPMLQDLLYPANPKPANVARAFCANFTPDNQKVFITFEHGGLAIVQLKHVDETGVTIFNPPVLKEVYAEAEYPGEGCGLLQHADGQRVFTVGASKLFDQELIYVWDMVSMGDGLKNDLMTTIALDPSGRGDAHGPMFTMGGKYMWVAMRMDNEIKVIDTDLNQVVRTLSVSRGECGTGGDGDGDDDGQDEDGDDCLLNLTPDVLDVNPSETLMFMTLRGYCPLTALNSFPDEDAHRVCPNPPGVDPVTLQPKVETDGRRPGLAVFKINKDGTRGPLVKIYRFKNQQPDTNPANDGVLDVVDPHGVKVVTRGGLGG
jgi:hypothetical protein